MTHTPEAFDRAGEHGDLNSSRLTRNTTGGGGSSNEGTAVLNVSRVTGNTPADPGGGILDVNTLTRNSTVVSGDVPDDCACWPRSRVRSLRRCAGSE